MKYMGSKSRVSKDILPIMLVEAERYNFKKWVEPFVGGGNVIKNVPKSFSRFGYDNNKHLMAMFNHIKNNGFDFTEDINKALYDDVRKCYNDKTDKYSDSFIGWVGFMGSANGRFFDGGYSGISKTKVGTVRNYIDESIRGLKKEWDDLNGVNFECLSYENLDTRGSLIYCDPPYFGVKTYNTSKNFEHDKFWDWCRGMAETNIVFVSEYNAPKDFECVWEKTVKSSLSANGVCGGNKNSLERLFKI